MKAAVIRRTGPADVIEIVDLATPEPASNEVLIEVARCRSIRSIPMFARVPWPWNCPIHTSLVVMPPVS